jgi:hypothetical protein
VTNFGALAILALPKMPERQLRFLLALETFTRGEDGWREAGAEKLIERTGLSVNTAIKARGELVAAGAIDYRRGNGAGHVSVYRIRLPGIGDHLGSRPKKVPKNVGDLKRYPTEARKGTQTRPKKVPKRNAVTSGNAFGGLEPSGLDTSGLPARVPVVDQLRAIDASVTEEVSAEVMKIIKSRPKVRDPVAVLDAELRKGNGYSLIGEAKHNIDRAQWRRQDPRVKQDDPERYDPTDVVAEIRKERGWARKREER